MRREWISWRITQHVHLALLILSCVSTAFTFLVAINRHYALTLIGFLLMSWFLPGAYVVGSYTDFDLACDQALFMNRKPDIQSS